ncbi:hypothetical protein C8Q78DRAFT_541987 [Trametes maxima]|nr:hypothetical protein C8Q78DRAFT_541987 [Trametes maxima]
MANRRQGERLPCRREPSVVGDPCAAYARVCAGGLFYTPLPPPGTALAAIAPRPAGTSARRTRRGRESAWRAERGNVEDVCGRASERQPSRGDLPRATTVRFPEPSNHAASRKGKLNPSPDSSSPRCRSYRRLSGPPGRRTPYTPRHLPAATTARRITATSTQHVLARLSVVHRGGRACISPLAPPPSPSARNLPVADTDACSPARIIFLTSRRASGRPPFHSPPTRRSNIDGSAATAWCGCPFLRIQCLRLIAARLPASPTDHPGQIGSARREALAAE